MARYRSKPKIIDAARIVSVNGEDVIFDVGEGPDDWLQACLDKQVGDEGGIWVLNEGVRIGTLEGTMRAKAGDFIVRGVKGEIYAVREDIFHATYEPLEP